MKTDQAEDLPEKRKTATVQFKQSESPSTPQ